MRAKSCWCAHVGYSPTGEVFNLAWEDVAENVAVALKADKLLMFTDRLPADRRERRGERAHGARSRGARGRKRPYAADRARARARGPRARRRGRPRASRLAPRPGLAPARALYPHRGRDHDHRRRGSRSCARRASRTCGGILGLIEPLEAEGTLVKRSRELLEAEIGNFFVVEHDGAIRGCAALYPFPDDKSGEFACLAVAPEYRDAGYGERLLLACEERAKSLSCAGSSR